MPITPRDIAQAFDVPPHVLGLEPQTPAEVWREEARSFILARYPVGFSFSGNDVWEAPGFPAIENRRELGYVLRRLENEGRLEAWAWTKSKGGHGQTIKVYRVTAPGACECRGMDEAPGCQHR